ncbi:MAG: hypothetical protein RLZZ187_974 [Pseudomonadota bacterium]|jgi:hypothetical protein
MALLIEAEPLLAAMVRAARAYLPDLVLGLDWEGSYPAASGKAGNTGDGF